jgi:hypothetical protein
MATIQATRQQEIAGGKVEQRIVNGKINLS